MYDASWLQIIQALATLIDQESELVFAALDNRDPIEVTPKSNYREEPLAFFFIIYGLCFKRLLEIMNRDDTEARRTISIVLDCLNKFIRPSISGNALYKSFVFSETTDLLDRLVLMAGSDVQPMVIKIAASLAKHFPTSLRSGSGVQYPFMQCTLY
jgi:HEAT repeat-containing protein 5